MYQMTIRYFEKIDIENKQPFSFFIKKKAYGCFLIRFAQAKMTLFIFCNRWVSTGKRKFSASKALFSCNTLRKNKVTIFLS